MNFSVAKTGLEFLILLLQHLPSPLLCLALILIFSEKQAAWAQLAKAGLSGEHLASRLLFYPHPKALHHPHKPGRALPKFEWK